jgi:hypothetical protein
MNEIEAKRVERAVERLANEIEPLPDEEVAKIAYAATVVARARSRRPRRWRIAAPVALAGAAAASLLAVPWVDRSDGPSTSSAATSGEIVQFPEGSALDRLLAAAQKGRNA